MNKKLTITLIRRSTVGWLCWLLILLPFAFGFLTQLLPLPDAVKYSLDIVWVALLAVIVSYRKHFSQKNLKTLIGWVLLFLLYTLMTYIPQYQSGLYYLWGVRNNFRFYAAFFALVLFLRPVDVDYYFRWFDRLFWINVPVTLIQFFALGINQDNMGGIFGIETGCNGYTNIFFCIVIAKSVIWYLEKKESLFACILKFVTACIIAAMAELKFFFVEAVVIVILAALFTSFSWRKLWIILGSTVIVLAGAAVLAIIFPQFSGFFSLEFFLDMATSSRGYTGSGDVNRLNFYSVVNERFLHNWGQRLFGLGLGNCERSGFALLQTPFFEQFEDTHYYWMSTSFTYVETGLIGLILYFGFFFLVFRRVWQIERHCAESLKPFCRVARIMAIMCMIISVYNASLRAEGAYMAYFALAVPFALDASRRKQALRAQMTQRKLADHE